MLTKIRKMFVTTMVSVLLAALFITVFFNFMPNAAEASSTRISKYDIVQCTCTGRDSLRIRDSDLGGGTVIGKFKAGDFAVVLNAGRNGFYYIQTRSGLKGYAHSSYLSRVDCEIVVAVRKLPVFRKPNKYSARVATLAKGERCWMRWNKNGWACILTKKGVIGWTAAKYLWE